MNLSLNYDQPVPTGGRIHAYSGAACIGVVYPLSDGRATWWLQVTGDRGEAKTVDLAKMALVMSMLRWMDEAGLQQIVSDDADQGRET